MKKQLCLVALGVALSMGMAHAADTKEPTKQQNKMGECNKSAGDTKGDDRKAYRKECLSAAGTPAPEAKPMTQGQKLGACSKEAAAKGLKGEEANKFKSACAKA